MSAAILYRNNPDGSITCTACRRYCRLRNGQTGFCGIRTNSTGRLDLQVHSLPFSVNVDPIEKKPVLHAYPGVRIYSFGTTGCNFACRFCQNYEMSQRREVAGIRMSPEDIVDDAVRMGCSGIAYTYNEPTIFAEFAQDVGLIAHRRGLFNIFVTNGYETPESVDLISNFLDFATVDFKGDASPEFYRRYMSVPDPSFIFDTISLLLEKGIHVEVTDLVIPQVVTGDTYLISMIERLQEIAGNEVPLSFLRYHPDYRMTEPSTPLDLLRNHYTTARRMGMKYVYIGNVPGISEQNTYCPSCGSLVVERDMLHTLSVRLTGGGNCPACGAKIPIILGKFTPGIGSEINA